MWTKNLKTPCGFPIVSNEQGIKKLSNELSLSTLAVIEAEFSKKKEYHFADSSYHQNIQDSVIETVLGNEIRHSESQTLISS